MPTQAHYAGSLSESVTRNEKEFIMSDSAVKVVEKPSSSSMPTLTETPDQGVPTDLPTEVVLAILYSQAKTLEGKALAQILTGTTPNGETVTYIRMTGVNFVKGKGFALATEK